MKLLERRREAALAEGRLALEQQSWRVKTRSIRMYIARHREAWIVGSGLAGGFVIGLFPFRHIGRLVSLAASTASFMVGTPIVSVIAESFARGRDGTGASGPSDTNA